MLRLLSIKRLAVIDSVEVEFERGLNVLTGETGAGKSILVEAVGLLLGGRASGDLVRTGEDQAIIEAIFERRGEEILVRRELSAQGRSRAFINDALATAGGLRELSSCLIELHGQHEHHTLLDPTTHLATLDAFGSNQDLLAATAVAFDGMCTTKKAFDDAHRAAIDRESRQELVTFQLGELDKVAPKPGEDEELTALRQVLASAERIERLCEESYAALYERDDAILAGLGGVWRRVGELATLDSQFAPYVAARTEIKSQLEDLALFLRKYTDGIQASPERLQQVEERLAQLERVKRKHGPTLGDVIDKRERLRRELADLGRSDERVAELALEYHEARRRFLVEAEALATERRRVARALASELQAALAELAMEKTSVEVRFNRETLPEPAWTAQGIDQVEFYLSPNPGEELRPLARIVSGGELSRIMLAIKTLVSVSRHGLSRATDGPPSDAAPGLIFDEVDAGIGGRVADVVGRKLRALGSAFQVLCITHLPQIAAAADTHFYVEKTVQLGRTRTTVRRLDRAGRVEEIARMLGGESVTDGVRETAREMLDDRSARSTDGGVTSRRSEAKPKGESERAKGETPHGTGATTVEVREGSHVREDSGNGKRRAR